MLRILLFLSLLLTGCTTTKTVELDLPYDQDSIDIQAGDWIELTTKNGDQYTIRVTSVTESVIESDQQSFYIEEIEKVEKTELTPGGKVAAGTAGFVLGYALSALTTMLIMAIIW